MDSPLQKKRLSYTPVIPALLRTVGDVKLEVVKNSHEPAPELKSLFPRTFEGKSYLAKKGKGKALRPLKVGAVFSGGPAAGGHNVIAALFDSLKGMHASSKLIGFLDGPSGILENRTKELDEKLVNGVRNLGGFDLIGSGRTKIETAEEPAADGASRP